MHDESLWLEIAWLCLLISLMAIGGANAMVPEIHRYVIEQRGWMRGDELLKRIEARARAQGIKTLFVLTTRTAHWFRERGFEPSSVERMPAARASLYNYQRNSKVFEKTL